MSGFLARSLYVLFGTIYLAAGMTALLFGTGVLPEALKNIVLEIARGDLNAVHITQEFGSLLVFAGLITFWFAWHYEQSRFFHWAMTAFWAIFALIHWFDVRGRAEFDIGDLINSIPFILFLSVGLVTRYRTEAAELLGVTQKKD
jgi:hypothetical protein